MIKEIPFNLIFLGYFNSYFNINFIFLCHFNRNNINFFLLGDSIRFTWLKDPIYVPVGHLRRQAASDWFRPCHAPYWGKCINPPHFQPTQPSQAQNPGTRVCNCRLEWGTRVNRGSTIKTEQRLSVRTPQNSSWYTRPGGGTMRDRHARTQDSTRTTEPYSKLMAAVTIWCTALRWYRARLR